MEEKNTTSSSETINLNKPQEESELQKASSSVTEATLQNGEKTGEEAIKTDTPVKVNETSTPETTVEVSTTTPKKKSSLGIIIALIALLIILVVGGGLVYSMLTSGNEGNFFSNFFSFLPVGNNSQATTTSETEETEESESDTESSEESGEMSAEEEALLSAPAEAKLIAWIKWNSSDHQFYLYAKKGDVVKEVGIFTESVAFIDWIDDNHFAFQVESPDYTTTMIKVYDWETGIYQEVYSTELIGNFLADFVNPDVFVYRRAEAVLGEDGYNMQTTYWIDDIDADYQLTDEVRTTTQYGREFMLYDAISLKVSPDGEYFFDIDTGPSMNYNDATYYNVDVFDLQHDDGMYWADKVTTITSATYPFWRDADSIVYLSNPAPRKLMQYDIDTDVTTELGTLSDQPSFFSFNPALDILVYSSGDFWSVDSAVSQFDLDSGANLSLGSGAFHRWAGDNVLLSESRVACTTDCGIADYSVTSYDLVSFDSGAVVENLLSESATFLTGY